MFRSAVLSLVLATGCMAQSPGCQDAATTAAMRDCENTRYARANRDLNAIYTRLMRELSDNQRQKLRIAEQAWVLFRDRNAAFLAGAAAGGTLEPLIRISASADMTEARVKDLSKFARP